MDVLFGVWPRDLITSSFGPWLVKQQLSTGGCAIIASSWGKFWKKLDPDAAGWQSGVPASRCDLVVGIRHH